MDNAIWEKAEPRSFESNGCEVHYWFLPGSGDRYVIMLHGASCDHRMFEYQIPLFDDSYNVIVWDARAHGLSTLDVDVAFSFDDMLDDLLLLFELHGIDEALLIGQSMGGNLSQELLYRYPDKVAGMVLIDCSRNTAKLSAIDSMMVRFTRPMFALYPWKTMVEQSAKACSVKPEVQDYMRGCFMRMGKNRLTEVMISLMTCLHEDDDYVFPLPVLLLCGTKDPTGNIRRTVTAWAQSDPNCQLVMVEGAAHNANQDAPEEVGKAIKEYLATL